jgi:hypothetical protein
MANGLTDLGAASAPFGSRLVSRILAGVTGVALGAGLGLESTTGGDPASVLVAVLAMAGITALTLALRPGKWTSTLLALLFLGFALRVAAAATIFASSVALGRGGFVTGDDAAYGLLAWSFVQFVRGNPQPPRVPPFWNGDDYLFGPFVFLESAIFFLFGDHVVLVEILNAALLIAAALLFFDVCRRAFSGRAAVVAATVIALYPSLILWSALNLKEALVILLLAIVLWSLQRGYLEERFRYVLLAALVLIPLRGLRVYAYLGLAALIPVATVATSWARPRVRRRWAVGAVAAVAAMVFIAGIPGVLADPLTQLDSARRNNALGARTSFVEPAPVEAKAGDTFVVIAPGYAVGTPTPGTSPSSPTAPAGPSPTVVVVQPGTRIVLAPTSTGPGPAPSAPPGTVYVHPGDVVFVAGSSATPAPPADRRPLPLFDRRDELPAAQLSSGPSLSDPETLVFAHTLSHIPTGVVHALFAPLVWESRGASELAGAAENILWYPLIVAAAATCWRERRRWRLYVPTLLAAMGFLAVLAIAEGNVGSLFRHRSMVVPLAAVLAAPTIVDVFRRIVVRSSSPAE